MRLTKQDLINFYDLINHYNKSSPNVAVVGTEKEFKKKMKAILKSIKKYDCIIFSNTFRPKYTIFINNIEYSYIHIEKTDDMKGLYFRKFI